MLDTHAVARLLTNGEFTPGPGRHANPGAARLAAEHGATTPRPISSKAGFAEVPNGGADGRIAADGYEGGRQGW